MDCITDLVAHKVLNNLINTILDASQFLIRQLYLSSYKQSKVLILKICKLFS